MSELVQLARLQRDLKQGIEALVERLEHHPDSPNLYAFVGIADRCMRLERDISLMTRELLEGEQPLGVA